MKIQFIQLISISIGEMIKKLPSHSIVSLCYFLDYPENNTNEKIYTFLLGRMEFFNMNICTNSKNN